LARPIVFLSDFGLGNVWVGICHSVMSRISPRSPIVDLSHLIRPLEVASGAILLADSMPFIAEDAVVLAIVDPNVGRDSEIAIETESGRILVGPDNGLLSLAWQAAGGIRTVVELTEPEGSTRPIAASFRAPDTLCPAAARLAAGTAIDEIGALLPADALKVVTIPEPEIRQGEIRCEVIDFNRFGNVRLNVRPEDLSAAGLADTSALEIEAHSDLAEASRGDTYADFPPGAYGVILDPLGWLTIVRGNPASALEGLALALGDPVWIRRYSADVDERR
jgi:S-adenosyl-L-methionine hydrolase (adenosine-forming)